MRARSCRCINCITPPHVLKKLLDNSDARVRDAALRTLLATSRLRGERSVRSLFASAAAASSHGRRTISDCSNGTFLATATVARTEDGPAANDEAVNRAFEGLGDTRAFYSEVFDRDSLDGHGMRLNAYVHYGSEYNNAFWNGSEMVFGDGDGVLFTDFTKSIDVIAHELTHGVTEFTAGLQYHNQSGALNESMSDVFGSLVKQWVNKQTAVQADWLIGTDIFTPAIGADALRSLKEPGKAYNSPTLGRDPQPDHMSKYVNLPDNDAGDNGGVHINSGIPNKAFYLAATNIGGFAWEAPGHIWYAALLASTPSTDFQEFADTTYLKSGQLYGTHSAEQQAVLSAWKDVGIRISGVQSLAGTSTRMRRQANGNGHDEDPADVARKIEQLSAQLAMLSKEVAGLKSRGKSH
ncbi:M4 family metallopeptidase [Bradyrhizobium sp. BRP22]|uniref:M4 family metallopeptidase n=1 Tax=Bradyrhizobium sp. BRP22 TaxID=2793821 RepID=UPI001CD6F4BA|nr:M4 family metallopeptidase [Bradyrhizobium sp. BRP22]MCA1454728.1 M4 family metallopeptidase [Bradyrhizobium sp. BRP22]